MKPEYLYDEIVNAYMQIRDKNGEKKFKALLDKDHLLTAVKQVDIKKMASVLNSRKYSPKYLGLTLDLALQAGVSLKGQSADSEPAVAMVSLLLDAKADPNDYIHLGFGCGRKSFLQEASSPQQNSKMVKVLLDKGAKQQLRGPFGVAACLEFVFSNKTFDPITAWYLFVAAGFNFKAIFASENLFTQVIVDHKVEVLIFFKAISAYFVSQRRAPVLEKTLKFLPDVLTPVIMGYTDDLSMTTDDVATKMGSEPREWQPLADDDWLSYIKKESSSHQFDSKSLKPFNDSPNQEICVVTRIKEQMVELFFPPLMLAAGMGNLTQVKILIQAKADPTVTLNGNTALIWALHGGRKEYASIAQRLCSQFISEENSNSSCVIA